MIAKQLEQRTLPSDPRQRAGAAAERQMAFYLNREFSDSDSLLVLNDLRLVDPEQPEHDGRPGVCQIDHLALHRWGAFIIESKSVTDEVAVRDDGSGGDEWTRRYKGQEHGFPSPIQQARRQGKFLRAFLQRHRELLLGKMPAGLRTLAKLVSGTDQRGFSEMPIQIIIAISDGGKIRRVDQWHEPTKPFQTFVSKADLVAQKILEELVKHESGGSLLGESQGEYGLWAMKPEEAGAVADLLLESHQASQEPPGEEPRPTSATQEPAECAKGQSSQNAPQPRVELHPACKQCGSSELAAKWGKFGYYWKCTGCEANTSMPVNCGICGAEGHRGKIVRIRKEGPKYFRACEKCGIEECIWTEHPR